MEAEGSDGRRRGKTVRQWPDQQPTAAATEAPACSFIFNYQEHRAFQRNLLWGLGWEQVFDETSREFKGILECLKLSNSYSMVRNVAALQNVCLYFKKMISDNGLILSNWRISNERAKTCSILQKISSQKKLTNNCCNPGKRSAWLIPPSLLLSRFWKPDLDQSNAFLSKLSGYVLKTLTTRLSIHFKQKGILITYLHVIIFVRQHISFSNFRFTFKEVYVL